MSEITVAENTANTPKSSSPEAPQKAQELASVHPLGADNDNTRASAAAARGTPAIPAAQLLPPHQAVATPQVETSALGSWFSRNRWFTKDPFTYLGYQFVRSGIAAVPYGFMMALGHHVFSLFSVWGQKLGLTEKGIQEFGKQGGVLGLEKLANSSATIQKELYQEGARGIFGRGLMRLGNSPLNAAIQIGLGFTLFRFTGGLIKNLRDRIINDRNTEAETIHETKNWWQIIKETARINWRAESVSTPIAAIVLGFMNASYTQPAKEYLPNPVKGETFWTGVKRVLSPKSKLFQNAMTWTLSYSLFFLLAEELFRDMQVRRGLWKGHPNSLKNGPDDVVGGPGAVHYQSPEEEGHAKNSSPAAATPAAEVAHAHVQDNKPAEQGQDDRAKDTRDKLRFPFFTGEPSMGRFLIRRVLPVCVGISAYAALKRVGYLADLGAIKPAGMMTPLAVDSYNKMKAGSALETIGNHAKLYWENTRKEAGATVMFGSLWWAMDAWGNFFDKVVHHLQDPKNAVELNDNQQKHHAELLSRLNEKYRTQGRAA